jgi:hypothetical protein
MRKGQIIMHWIIWTVAAWLLLPTVFALCLIVAVARQPLWIRSASARRRNNGPWY